MEKKDEGIEKYRWVVTEQSWGCEVSIGSIVNNVTVTMFGARWVPEISIGGTPCKMYNCLTTMLYNRN